MNKPARAERTESNEVLYDLDDGIAVITLNAPERMNTISGPMLNELTALLIRADEDPAVRCVILTGNGRAFCAGLDLRKERSGEGLSAASSTTTARSAQHPADGAARHGQADDLRASTAAAAGYGMDTALGCDIRIMAESAKAGGGLRQARRGAGVRRHVAAAADDRLGEGLRNDFYGPHAVGARMPRLGLANEVVPDAEVLGRARAVAREIAANAPLAVQAAKRMMRMGLNESFPRSRASRLSATPAAVQDPGHAGRHQGLHGKARAEIRGPLNSRFIASGPINARSSGR